MWAWDKWDRNCQERCFNAWSTWRMKYRRHRMSFQYVLRPCCSRVSLVRSPGGILSICATPEQIRLNVFLFCFIFRLCRLSATAVLCVVQLTPPAPLTLQQCVEEEPQNNSRQIFRMLTACVSPQNASKHLPQVYQPRLKCSCRRPQLWGYSAAVWAAESPKWVSLKGEAEDTA